MSEESWNSSADEMLTRDWPELSPLVDLLLDTRASDRAPLLMHLSAGSFERQRTLERLLAECERDLPLLNRPAAERFDQLVGKDEAIALPELVAGRYRTAHEVGQGGMAHVYLAHDIKHDRDVAIKVIRAELSATLGRDRFLREIGIVARLRHPNILPLYDSGEANGSVYFVMPFEEGPSLRARLARDGPLSIMEALSVLRDVARALQYAHTQGVVHRDIKPDNVLLSGGAAVVTDFGIAKALSASKTRALGGGASGTLTQLSTSLGTPAYMAPEQAAGDPATDHRADLYAWGVMAYELLAGRHPFAGHTLPQALIAAHSSETPAPLPQSIPRAIAALVMRCLAKAPSQRPASVNELLAALDAASLTSGEQVVPPVASTRGHVQRAAPLALSVVVLALLVGGAWLWRTRADAAPDRLPLVAVLPFETVAGAGGIPPDSTFADGLGDAITGKLARLAGLRVIDRASVRSVADAAAHPQAAGRTLRADYVLRATLRWARGSDGAARVQVSPVLVRVVDGTTKWAGEPTVISPSDPFAAQGTISAEVAEALDVALAPVDRARLAQPPTADTASFAAVERGWRMLTHARTQADRVQALREFERAYQRDPQYADAFGKAAEALLWMVSHGAPPTLYDSAAVLARRALALDPGQTEAVESLARFELSRGRADEGLRLIERAARAFPSSAPLQNLLASALYQTIGDSAGAADAVTRAVALAPRSRDIVFIAMYTALQLRRYDAARDLLARARALEPEWLGVPTMAADLATAVGDTAGVSAAMRTLRAAGQGAQMLDQMRSGDVALQQELAAVSLASVGAASAVDSIRYYRVKAQLHLTRGEGAKARALVDSGYRLAASHAANLPAGAHDAPDWWRKVAWHAAARRDRPAAVAALRRSIADPLIAGHPGSQADARQTCTSAEVYGLLDDAETMLPLLRRCLTMPNGYHLAKLGEPAFARVRADPRVRALAAEISATQALARSTRARAGG